MSTQTLSAESKKASEIISYHPATGEESRPRAVSFAEGRPRSRAQGARGATCLGQVVIPARGRVILGSAQAHALPSAMRLSPGFERNRQAVAEGLSMEIVPRSTPCTYFAHASENLLRPQKIDIGPLRL